MADKYLMDGHKMMWHLDRVQKWKEGERTAPLHIDVGLSKGCNIKCHYCFGALQGNEYKKGAGKAFPRDALLNYIRSAGEMGVRSMAFIGEAEPTLNPALNEAIIEGPLAGIDVSLATNGILFHPEKETLKNLTWVRYNLSAASDGAYRRLHGSKEFDKVMDSVSRSVDLKGRHGLDTTIGLQMVLTPKDVDEVVPLAKLGRELEVDYFVIKQCSDTLESKLGTYDKLEENREKYKRVLTEAATMGSENYNVVVKWNKIMNTKQDYGQCLGTSMLLYSSGDGKLFPCGMFFNEEHWDNFMIGDLTKQSFREIIESDKYEKVVNRTKGMVAAGRCYAGCRTNAINSFLWKVKNGPEGMIGDLQEEVKLMSKPQHVNFV